MGLGVLGLRAGEAAACQPRSTSGKRTFNTPNLAMAGSK